MGSNRKYWDKRAEENAERVYRYAQRQARLVTRWFGRAQREMETRIKALYRQCGGQLSLKNCKAAMVDQRTYAMTLKEYQALAERAPQDAAVRELLSHASINRAISRQEYLIMQLNLLATELYLQHADLTERSLTQVFEESYYKSLFDQQQFVGYGHTFNRLNTNRIQAAITTAWKGKNYSQRLWGDHRQTLARYLDRVVTTGVIRGAGNRQMVDDLRKAMDMSAYEARRLIRTECSQVSSRANKISYQDNDVEEFEFLAVLDYRTSEICREKDKKVYKVKDGKVGVNMPPLHPFCRSTTVPHIPDAEFDGDDTRAARNGAGKTYKVPASMTYKEWYQKHVADHADERLAERKLRNGTADAKQFRAYQERLGDKAPKTFDDFQMLKYTDVEEWTHLKSRYRSAGYYKNHLTPDERGAVQDYVGSASYKINAKLREGLPLGKDDRDFVTQLDNALNKTPVYEGTVVRSLVLDQQDLIEFATRHRVGDVVTYSAYTSASTLEDYHDRPTVRLNINSHTGRDIRKYNEAEDEILFKRGTRFKVLSAKMDNGMIVLEMEEYDGNETPDP